MRNWQPGPALRTAIWPEWASTIPRAIDRPSPAPSCGPRVRVGQIVPPGELADLGQHFADLEHQQFGIDEFTAMVARVTSIEQRLGIYNLAQFTPQVSQYTPPA